MTKVTTMDPVTKQEIVTETVEYYSADPENQRSATITRDGVEFSACVYWKGETGCAVGRCLKPEVKDWLVEEWTVGSEEIVINNPNLGSISDLIRKCEDVFDVDRFDQILEPKYRGHEANFWCVLQTLHDNDENWTENGISERGRSFAEQIINDYQL